VSAFEEHNGLWVPNEGRATVEKAGPSGGTAILDNRTDLPDYAILDYFEENTAAFGWSGDRPHITPFGGGTGSALARQRWQPPQNIIEEIKLARDLAERDDDVAPAIEMLLAAAFADGYQNQHPDEQIEHTFEKLTEDMGLRRVLMEFYREWLISYQINSVTIFTRASYDIRPEGTTRVLTRNVASPLCGVLPAENIRVLGDDLFGNAALAYVPEGELAEWLQRYFGSSTTPAKKAEMRRLNPVRAALFVEKVNIADENMRLDLFNTGADAYRLNPAMVARSTAAKGVWPYPRPPMTRNLPLLEAKRLLNIMDHALLQGGTNYIIVAKKGSKEQPALQPEIDNLREVVKRASRTGVLIGDHRVEIEIVTPDLSELLNPAKRAMIGHKLSTALLRVPQFAGDDKGQSVVTFTELLQRVVTSDRSMVRDHIHDNVWSKVMSRNQAVFGRADRPGLWFPRIILQGFQFFTDYLLKMYDRGDLPRKWMVEFGGFDYEAAIAQKKRENDNNHDQIFQPPAVPFSSPQNGPGGGSPGPQDQNPGPGRGNTSDPRAPSRVIRRTPGETVRAYWSEDEDMVIRIGELTDRIIREYPDCEIGRMTPIEIEACTALETMQRGPTIVVPVNTDAPMDDLRVVRLDEGLAIITGRRQPDGAVMTRAICAREPLWNRQMTEDIAIRWGYDVSLEQPESRPEPPTPSPPAPSPGPPDEQRAMEIHVHVPNQGEEERKAYRMVIERDDEGRPTGSRYEPIEES
jgi:hypothetical protein